MKTKLLNGKVEINGNVLLHIFNNYSLYIYGRDKNDEEMRKKYQERLFEDADLIAKINGLEEHSEEATELYCEIMKLMRDLHQIEQNDYDKFCEIEETMKA